MNAILTSVIGLFSFFQLINDQMNMTMRYTEALNCSQIVISERPSLDCLLDDPAIDCLIDRVVSTTDDVYRQEFLREIIPHAIRHMIEFGIPASFKTSQASLESSYGTSGLSSRYNNLYGITYGGNEGDLITGYRKIKDNLSGKYMFFCTYSDWAASIYHNSVFLQGDRYAHAIGISDCRQFAETIHAAGYATDKHYVDKIVDRADQHDLHLLDEYVFDNFFLCEMYHETIAEFVQT